MRLRIIAMIVLAQLWLGIAWAQPGPSGTQPVRILAAHAGLFGPPETGSSGFVPSANLPLRDGQAFGWKFLIQTSRTRVLVREELTLPAEPKTWGDPEPDLKRKTSADGRTATTEVWLEPKDGVIFHSWTVTRGDPKGTWVLRVWVDGQAERSFRLEAR